MPYDYEIFPEQNVAVVTASGRIAGADIIEAIQRMDEDERWVAGMHQMCDYLDVKGVAVSISELRQIVSLEKLHLDDTRGGKLALLAESFDMRTICELFCLKTRVQGREARVFRNREEALAWLGIPADQA